jgi:hypothetical protein
MKTPQQAQAEGYKPLTNPYGLCKEQREMLARALDNLAGIDHCLVYIVSAEFPGGGIEIWRKGMVTSDQETLGIRHTVRNFR